MPEDKRKYHIKKRGYRQFYSRPKKGCRPYSRKSPVQSLPVSASDMTDGGDQNFSDNSVEFLGFNTPFLRGIRCLSLFDGIGSGLLVLDQLNIQVDSYFSSEIDEKAIKVLKYNHSDRIVMLGCVKGLTNDKLRSLGQIDLLIGGSPCSDFSFANPRRQGLKGEQGKLFFEFERILKFLSNLAAERGHQFYWLFENTYPLETNIKDRTTRSLGGCVPIMRCASSFVPMRRRRYFWSNLLPMAADPTPTICTLQEHLMPYRQANVNYLPTLTTTSHSQRSGHGKNLPVSEDGQETYLLITEEETLFGFPRHYTDANLSMTDRRKLLGKSWCIPVVTELLKPLSHFFLTVLDSNKK